MDIVRKADFDAAVKKHSRLIVDFWAPWCSPCRAMGSMLTKLAKSHPSITVAKVNVDECDTTLPKRYKIRAIPFVMLFKDGKHVETIVGAESYGALVATVDQFFGKVAVEKTGKDD